jgi:hypothetical protein
MLMTQCPPDKGPLEPGWAYISVWVQETWGSKHPLMDLTFKLKIGPKLEVWLFKLGGVFS